MGHTIVKNPELLQDFLHCMSRNDVRAILNASTSEAGQEVLSEYNELRNLTPIRLFLKEMHREHLLESERSEQFWLVT